MAINAETDPASVGRAYFEAVGRRDLEAMTAFYEPGGVGEIHGLVSLVVPDELPGLVRRPLPRLPRFQDGDPRRRRQRREDGRRWRATGTFDGSADFEGLAPNGAGVNLQGCDVLTIRDGRIQHNDAYMNGAEMMRQLGALPPVGSAPEKAMTAALNAKTRVLAAVRQRRR